MDTITSTEFRRAYAQLKVPTIVTVNGHRIGAYFPDVTGPAEGEGVYGTRSERPFTPVPKPGKRGK